MEKTDLIRFFRFYLCIQNRFGEDPEIHGYLGGFVPAHHRFAVRQQRQLGAAEVAGSEVLFHLARGFSREVLTAKRKQCR